MGVSKFLLLSLMMISLYMFSGVPSAHAQTNFDGIGDLTDLSRTGNPIVDALFATGQSPSLDSILPALSEPVIDLMDGAGGTVGDLSNGILLDGTTPFGEYTGIAEKESDRIAGEPVVITPMTVSAPSFAFSEFNMAMAKTKGENLLNAATDSFQRKTDTILGLSEFRVKVMFMRAASNATN